MKKLNFIQKKILYLNIVMLIVFLFGSTLAIIGFTPLANSSNHMMIIETFGLPMVTASLGYWGFETKAYISLRKEQVKQGEKDVKKD